MSKHPRYCEVTQYEWSILDPAVPATTYFRIHHRALSEHFRAIVDRFKVLPAMRAYWSKEVGEDIGNPAMLARLMLKASLVLNPASILLFSSKDPIHIHENIAAAGNNALDGPALRLYEVFQREHPELP